MAKVYLDFEKIPQGRLIVRERKLGDRLAVSPNETRKVRKLFDERGLGPALAERIPLVEIENSVLWVPGIAGASFAAIEQSSRSLLELSYRRRE
jgi:tRNA(Ile)-lysidine synthetase-like protein